jgi:hypothetical protein
MGNEGRTGQPGIAGWRSIGIRQQRIASCQDMNLIRKNLHIDLRARDSIQIGDQPIA